jgi:hypothetical protein
VVADMGCGDGTLLKTIYLYVKTQTKRGKVAESSRSCTMLPRSSCCHIRGAHRAPHVRATHHF